MLKEEISGHAYDYLKLFTSLEMTEKIAFFRKVKKGILTKDYFTEIHKVISNTKFGAFTFKDIISNYAN